MKKVPQKLNVANNAFDIVLIYSSMQRNCFYASIVKYLSCKYVIGIFVLDYVKKSPKRIEKSDRKFLTHCRNLGAHIINNESVSSKIEIITQAPFNKKEIQHINSKIKSMKTFFHIGIAMGNAFYKNLYNKNINKILVPDLAFYSYRLNVYGNDDIDFPASKIVEVGIPFKKYPFFQNKFEIDYIVATPTPFSFTSLKDRLEYLENLFSILSKINDKTKIYYKPHNADERVDYIVNKKFLLLTNLFITKFFREKILDKFKVYSEKINIKILKKFCLEICIAILYKKCLQDIKNLSDLTEFHFLNLEIFLPFVKKGLITGRSNSIWHGLYSRLPVYNCVKENKEYFSETKMHKYSMKYYNVHGNYETLEFKNEKFDIVNDSTHRADLISFLTKEIMMIEKNR